jgi:hypothetical protein
VYGDTISISNITQCIIITLLRLENLQGIIFTDHQKQLLQGTRHFPVQAQETSNCCFYLSNWIISMLKFLQQNKGVIIGLSFVSVYVIVALGASIASQMIPSISSKNDSPAAEKNETNQEIQKPTVGSITIDAEPDQGPQYEQQQSSTPFAPSSSVGCTQQAIPYKTIYEDAPTLQKGQTRTSGGYDGLIIHCPATGKSINQPPVDKVISVGSYMPQTGPAQQELQARKDAEIAACLRNAQNTLGNAASGYEAAVQACYRL